MNATLASFTLPPSLGIRNVSEVARSWREHDTGGGVILDAGAVEEISTPGLQLLAACWQQARQKEQEFSLTHPTEELKTALQTAGLSYLLD